MIKSGLRWLFEATRQSFLDLSSIEVDGADVSWSATASGSDSGTGKPVIVAFPAGGTTGTQGINYTVSTDGGLTTSDAVELGTDTAVTVAFGGGTLVLSLSGAVADGASVTWTPQPIAFAFGELASLDQGNRGPGGRIVFSPGIAPPDDKTPRKLGKVVAPRAPGATSEPALGDLLEAFQIYCWSWDAVDASNQAQHDAALLLFTEGLWPTLMFHAGVLVAQGALAYQDDGAWLPARSHPFGREIVSGWAVRTPMVGAATALAYPIASYDEQLLNPDPEA